MSRKSDKPLGWPQDLPAEAQPHWPDLNHWPTPEDVAAFKGNTRRDAHARLAVMSGLRAWSEIDIAPIWAWASAILTLSLAGLGVAIAVDVRWVEVLSLVLTVAASFGFLGVLMRLSTTADLRRRRAHMWLRAFESEL